MSHEIYINDKETIQIIKGYTGGKTVYTLNFGEEEIHYSKVKLLKELATMIRAVGGKKYKLPEEK